MNVTNAAMTTCTPSDVTPPPEFSIIVPTYNRSGGVAAAVGALLQQQADAIDFEVLVVDNGSTDGTREVVQRFEGIDRRVHYIFEPRQGASHARNAGIARARGSIVAFVDDDVLPARDWLCQLQRAFEAHPEVDCIGGRVDPRWPPSVPPWITRQHFAPLALQMNRPAEFDANHASACLVTANFACRRTVFEEVGGFSPAFVRDEDREFNMRLWRAGKRGRYADDVRVVAPVDPSRLTKTYHRRWYETTGKNHARLRYREVIDRNGRLVEPLAKRTVLGTCPFVYREWALEVIRWVRAVVRRRPSDAFFHECRIRYFFSYIRTRAQLVLQELA